MAVPSIKQFIPRSLFGRTVLILLVPIVTIQLVVSYVFIQRLYQRVSVQMTSALVLDLAYLHEQAVTDADGLEAVAEALGLQVLEAGPPREGLELRRRFYDISGVAVIDVLRTRLPELSGVDLTVPGRVIVSQGVPGGELVVQASRDRASATNPHQLLVLMVFTSLLATLVAFLFLRNQVRPIRRLAAAAEAFGKGQIVPYRPTGATEVRAAGRAFLDMRGRIERHIEQRTLMLSGVSHDLRTPLTRLKLGLSMQPPDPEVHAMERDVEDMQRILETFLDFARGDALDDPQPVDPLVLAEDVLMKFRHTDGAVRLGKVEGLSGPVTLHPMAVERAIENLLANALRHAGEAELSVLVTERSLRYIVDDDGPGIPPAQRAEAVKPFTQLDPARNQNAVAGTGLGLAIVSDIARQHGGTLRLGDSPMGGLRAELVLAR